ncbi:SigE family RNA polymerase sigma factor [Homoserinibacter sp. GY 40078]|uniref:SigE family RNA polymerase sigma factor n=1 Tax=Homoserinibacter sp. GY 40078 TaxID=2603275 RepID=UPI0011C6EB0D|nr:SigE family RNA polymerase sigma factor [Homoserinibacter sp. GY 40078]TXK17240.1 SigE family RNA polymerase sigma factor [Homoserinibacter sp. GY 40078]
MARTESWEQVVAELVAERGDALLRYARLLTGSPDDAADLVQEALVRTFGRLRNGFGVERAEAYVRRAILNASLDQGRRVSLWRRIAPTQFVRDALPPADDDVELRLDLHEELAKLSPRERACLVLRYYDDLKVDDIAATLGISSGAVKRYLSDGLAKMAIALADDGTIADRLGPDGARPGTGLTPLRSHRTVARTDDRTGGDHAHRS